MSSEPSTHELLDPPQQAGEIGRLGPYRILSVLGKGGMGEVFRAEDGRLKRSVALKLMKKKIAATPNSRKRFVEEARSMAAVHHDNVATIFEVGIHRGMPFMAMEMLRGSSLDETMKGKKRFTWQQVLRLAKEVSRGLAAAHHCGIVHRDIKPANIWIEEQDGRAKILDFGLAIAGANVDRFAARGSVIGSPGYLAPEQARNEPVDDRTDLYSLGVVMYQMCSGRLPLRSSSIPGQLVAIICHNPPPLHEQNPDIPRPLCDLIHRLIAKEQRHRPKSAKQLEAQIMEVESQCVSESQGALQIVTADAASPTSASVENRGPSTESSKSKGNKKTIVPWVTSAGLLLVVLAAVAWYAKPKRVARAPTPRVVAPPPPEVRSVTARSLEPLELSVTTGTDQLMSGEAARFKMRLVNNASDGASDPKTVNSGLRVVAQIATLLKQSENSQVRRPTFAKKISATQLPPPGQSREIEIQFLTGDLPPESFDVVFELQTPSGQTVSSATKPLSVSENLRQSELLGFKMLRTHGARGADTYVRSGSQEGFGGANVLQTHFKRGKDGPLKEHIYLRFDLSKSPVPREELDRAVVLLTVEGGGNESNCTINAYGIGDSLDADWIETDADHLAWETSPCRDGVGGQRYLGQVTIDNFKDNLKNKPDAVRIFSEELDEFIRSSPSDLITIALIRENQSDKPSRFKSKEGKPSEAPALALRRRPQG